MAPGVTVDRTSAMASALLAKHSPVLVASEARARAEGLEQGIEHGIEHGIEQALEQGRIHAH